MPCEGRNRKDKARQDGYDDDNNNDHDDHDYDNDDTELRLLK